MTNINLISNEVADRQNAMRNTNPISNEGADRQNTMRNTNLISNEVADRRNAIRNTNEPPRGKTNNPHRRKQRRRSASR